MINAERLRLRIAALGLSGRKLAQMVGVSSQAISKMTRGETTSTSQIVSIAKALQTTPEYLIGESDDPSPIDSFAPVKSSFQPEDDDVVTIQEIDLTFGMGGSFFDIVVKERPRKFSRSWLRMFTDAQPSEIFLARGIGDSMAPTIHNDDIILVDTTANSIRMSDQIWAFSYGDFGMIKRLRPTPDGGILIMSDNPLISDATAYDGELHVIGKVVAIIRRMAS